MSANAAKLKKRAVELEQKKQFDKALALYIQFLQESEGALDDIDVPLYNRVGDLMLRTGNASDALNYYEKAVDLYADRGFLNNAIALCNKVLRQSPGRASIYYKLGKISATKGFKSDAKKNFLEYADRMQKAGQIDEAFRALKEFADLCPDQDDIRLMLAEQLTKENRHDEALEQLQKLHDKLDSEGRSAEARATVDRMKSIDPEAVPRVSGTYRAQKSSDLIFLDTSFEQASRARQASAPATAPESAPAPALQHKAPPTPLTPVGRQVSDPDLVMLTLSDPPGGPLSPLGSAVIDDGFALDLDTPNDDSATALPLLDIGGDVAGGIEVDLDAGIDQRLDEGLDLLPSAADLEEQVVAEVVVFEAPIAMAALDVEALPDAAFAMPPEADTAIETSAPVAAASTFKINAEPDPAPVDLVRDEATYVSGPPLGVDYAGDLHTDSEAVPATSMDDLFDFRAPPRSEDAVEAAPSINLDPDVAFPSFDLDDTSLPSADEITSGGSLAAALFSIGEDTLGAGLDIASDARESGEGAAPHAESLDDEVDWPTTTSISDATPAASVVPVLIDNFTIADEPPAHEPAADEPEAAIEVELRSDDSTVADAGTTGGTDVISVVDNAVVDIVDVDDLTAIAPDGAAGDRTTPSALHLAIDDSVGVRASSDEAVDESTTSQDPESLTIGATVGSVIVSAEVAAVVEPSAPTPSMATPSSLTIGAVEPAGEPEPPQLAGWEVQRADAERLLEAGDRAAGVRALEQVAVDLERIGDLERALTIIDELIRLTPETIRHHQKRVELAFRASDRVKLIDAYIELGDALFRSGEERKARAVYQRVLELAPDDPRAQAAVESVTSMSPPAGSGAIAAIEPPTPPADSRNPVPSARPHARDSRVAYQPGPGNGNRGTGGIVPPPPTRKPSPLDRAAAGGDFVDLGEWLRSGESPKSTRMVAEEKPPTGDEQADFQEMLKRFKQGVAENVDEEDYESHYDLGVAYKEMGLMDEAVAEFQKALRGTANRVRSFEALGQCFVEKEQYHVAASVLSRAIALGEGDDHYLVGVLYFLGRATEALGKHGDALDYYQRVFAVDIEFRDVAERISEIERKAP
jgi:tetratricopeptide (TPR) repeat protein